MIKKFLQYTTGVCYICTQLVTVTMTMNVSVPAKKFHFQFQSISISFNIKMKTNKKKPKWGMDNKLIFDVVKNQMFYDTH